jgi:hypothetical protein
MRITSEVAANASPEASDSTDILEAIKNRRTPGAAEMSPMTGVPVRVVDEPQKAQKYKRHKNEELGAASPRTQQDKVLTPCALRTVLIPPFPRFNLRSGRAVSSPIAPASPNLRNLRMKAVSDVDPSL